MDAERTSSDMPSDNQTSDQDQDAPSRDAEDVPFLPSESSSTPEQLALATDVYKECSESLPAVSSSSGSTEPADEHGTYVTTVGDDTPFNGVPKCSDPLDPLDVDYKKPKIRILGYCCPKCGTGQLASLQEAVQHCRKPEEPIRIVWEGTADDCDGAEVVGSAAAEALPSAGVPSASVPCAPLPEVRAAPLPALPGEPVAFNSYGQPIIARQVDPETGGSRTMVLNDDGTCDVFGKQTIASLLSSTETETDDWIQVLSDFQLRGLVHEMGQRLVESSQVYQARLTQWEQLSEKANLEFFGLSAGASDRELDVAYRQLSKKMHPDKNGGTEESKKRFQEMKTRYETLKKKRGEQDADQKDSKEPEDQEEDEEQPKEKDDKTIEFDPSNRESLHGTAKKMLGQLSTLDSGMANLVAQLKRHGL